MRPVKILIVENEFIISEKLTQTLRDAGYLVTGVATSGKEAVELVAKHLPDLIIMDIKLEGELDGIDTVTLINKNYSVPVIYLTGYTDQSLFTRAKFTRPASYLTKPYNPNDVFHAIELAIFHADQINNPVKNDSETTGNTSCILNDRIFVKDNKNCFIKVDISDILWIKGEGSYSVIETVQGKFTTSHNLKTIENKIGNPKLARVHRSYLINLDRVKQIVGRSHIVMTTDDLYPAHNEVQNNGNKVTAEKEITIPIGPEYREGIHQIVKFI